MDKREAVSYAFGSADGLTIIVTHNGEIGYVNRSGEHIGIIRPSGADLKNRTFELRTGAVFPESDKTKAMGIARILEETLSKLKLYIEAKSS